TLLVLAGAAGWWAYARRTAARVYIPGTFVANSWDDSETVVVEFLPDGEARREVYPPGADRPRLTASGRWRVTGACSSGRRGRRPWRPSAWPTSSRSCPPSPSSAGTCRGSAW